MAQKYQVKVFGKAGCDKCKLLNQRLDLVLQKTEWREFEKKYVDLDTEEGLVEFCRAECVNPQRVPALLVTRLDDRTGDYVPLPNPRPGELDEGCGRSRLYQVLGVQTDYSEAGRGVISPRMIEAVLEAAIGL